MNLYLTATGQYAGTQKDAGKGHTPVEVPTDKAGLIAYLNDMAPFEPTQALKDLGEPEAPPATFDVGHGPQPLARYDGDGRDDYVSPLSARTVIAGIDAGMMASALAQFDGPNLSRVMAAGIERMAMLARALPSI